MLLHTFRYVPALAVTGLLLLAGCSDSGARSLGPVPSLPTTSSTTTVPVTSTVAPATSTTVATTRPPATTTAGPRLVEGMPQVTPTPARATVGQRVRIEGTGFTDSMWRSADAPLWLAGGGNSGCDFFAPAAHSVTVSAAGRLTGEFTVPEAGDCRMTGPGGPLRSGTYRIVFSRTACRIGELEVTTPAAVCRDVIFTPDSDDLASAIQATGMTCTEAEALVRKAGPQTVIGSARFQLDGFVCARTAQSDRGLPSVDFECTSGPKKVTFTRT